MKKVFSNSQCCHVWAQQKQDEGRGHNIFFEKESIYSYGRHFKMAEFIRPDVVLVNSRGYSSSTSKHQGYVRGALHGLKVTKINVPGIASEGKVAISECCDRMMDQIENNIKLAVRARTDTEIYKRYASSGLAEMEAYLKYCKGMTPKQWARFRSLKKMLTSDDFTKLMPIIKAEAEATKKRNAERKARQAEDDRIRALKDEERLAEWLAGGNLFITGMRTDKTYLRVKGDKVQTSRGAEVPLSEAKVLLGLWTKGEVQVGYKIGHFEVETVEQNQIKIGCHYLVREEIERIAPQLVAA